MLNRFQGSSSVSLLPAVQSVIVHHINDIIRPSISHLGTALLTLFCLTGSAWSELEVKILDAGFNGLVRHDKWAPVNVEIINRGDNFKGALETVPANLIGAARFKFHKPSVSRPVSLPAGATKRFTAYVFMTQVVWYGHVALVDHKGRTVWKELTPRLNLAPQAGLVLAVGRRGPVRKVFDLSDEEDPNQRIRIVTLQGSALPDHWVGYDAVDAVVFYRADYSSLREMQKRALEDWINAGGTLVICYDDTMRGGESTPFPRLLPVRIVSGETTVPPGEFRVLATEPASEAVTIKNVELQIGRSFSDYQGRPLVVERACGAGRVIFLSFDIRQESVQKWNGRKQLVYYLKDGSVSSIPPELVQMATNQMQQLQELSHPPFWRLGLFLIFSIVIIGPVNYRMLSKRNRKEWAFATVPLLSLILSGGGYFWAKGVKGGQAILNRSSILCFGGSTDKTRRVEYCGFFSASPGEFELVPASHSARWERGQRWNGRGALISEHPFVGYRFDSRPGKVMSGFLPLSLTMNMWSYEVLKVQDLVEVGRLNAWFKLKDGKLEGELRNNTSFTITLNQLRVGQSSFGGATVEPGNNLHISRVLFNDKAVKKGDAEKAMRKVEKRQIQQRRNNFVQQRLWYQNSREGGPYVYLSGRCQGDLPPSFTIPNASASERQQTSFYAFYPLEQEEETEYYPAGTVRTRVTSFSNNLVAFYNSHGYMQPSQQFDAAQSPWTNAYLQQNAFIEFAFVVPSEVLKWKKAKILLEPVVQQQQRQFVQLEIMDPKTNKMNPIVPEQDTVDLRYMNPQTRMVTIRLKAIQAINLYDLAVGLQRME